MATVAAVAAYAGYAVAGVSAASAVAGAVSANQSATAQKKAQEFNQKTALENARLAQMQARADHTRLRRTALLARGAQRAGYSASGVNSDSGDALDVLADTTEQGELDVQRRGYGADIESLGLTRQASIYGAQARATGRSSNLSAASALLGGISNVASY